MGAGVKTDRLALAIVLSLAAVLVGCAGEATSPSPVAPTTLAVSSPTWEAMGADAAERLISQRVDSPPAIDGQIDCLWVSAQPLRVPLTWGMDGTERALEVEMRALHTDEAVFFLAQWPGQRPSGEENTVANKLTLHWRVPEPAAQRLDCTIVCHTAFADGRGRFVYANAETIPQGGGEALPAAGAWDAGTWTLEWSRPLLNNNPFDLQFTDLEEPYSFLIKIFERVDGRPDPISERHDLVFGR